MLVEFVGCSDEDLELAVASGFTHGATVIARSEAERAQAARHGLAVDPRSGRVLIADALLVGSSAGADERWYAAAMASHGALVVDVDALATCVGATDVDEARLVGVGS
jgi:DMSO/TMAO reductase YedYZ molybdopterin-dependent catalytic subunit